MPSWKKLIVSGSDASLASLTTTGKLQLNSSETGSTIFEVNGVNGRLFTITDEMSGSLFNISTTAGLPVIEALSDGKVTLGPFSAQTEIDTSGNLELGGNISGSSTSTGSFGYVKADTFEGVFSFSDGTAELISGSSTSTGSFGHIRMNGRNFPPQLFTIGSSIYMGDGGTGLSDDGSGNDNVGIGTEVLTGIANGAHNVAIGNNALKARTVGSNNVAIGRLAGGSDADDFGSHNILIGESAGLNINNTSTSYNVMIGQSAGTAITNSSKNTFVGNAAGSTITTGGQNVAIGNNAGLGDGATAQTNQRSIFIGDAAKASANGNTNEIVIGKTTTGKGSNTVTIGNDDTTDFYITEGTQAKLHTGDVSGSSTSTGSFGRVENASGKFRALGTTAEISSAGLTQLHIFQDGLGVNSEAPTLKISNNSQGNNNDITLSAGTGRQLIVNGDVVAQDTFRGDAFDVVNERGTAGTAAFTATGNGGDGGGMFFGGGGAFDVRFSTTEKERLRIEKESDGGGIQTSGSVSIGGIGATDAGLTVAGNVNVGGNITAQNFIVSSSVTSIEYQSISGSTIFGDTADDTHTFLGDTISGSATSTGSFGQLVVGGANAIRIQTPIANASVFIGHDAGVDAGGAYNNIAIGRDSMGEITNGVSNIALGQDSLHTETTGDYNVAIGDSAMSLANDADYTIAIGRQAGMDLEGGSDNNTFIGYAAGTQLAFGDENIAIGLNALQNPKSGSFNIAMGSGALRNGSATDGNFRYNIAFGWSAANGLKSGQKNVAIGNGSMRNAGQNGTNIDDSIGIGYETLRALEKGDGNIAIGEQAMENTETGSYNIAIGSYALDAANNGLSGVSNDNNIAIGQHTGGSLKNGARNTLIGHGAMSGGGSDGKSITDNTFIGYFSAKAFQTGANNVVLGAGNAALYARSGSKNVVIGYRTAEGSNNVQADLGEENIFIGHWAAGGSVGAYRNIAMGYKALIAAQPGSEYNIAIGHEAHNGNNIGEYNIALGVYSQYQNDNGHNNISIGQKAMYEAGNDGHAILDNISIGRETTRYLENGDHNIAMGYQSFTTAVSGSYNILLGANAADAYVLYEDSVIIGAGAEANATGETNQIVIGHDAIGKGSNTAVIGDDNVTDIYMSEDVGATLHTGTVSGSAISTGSFGRVEAAGFISAEHIHSTDDMTVADDLLVDGTIQATGNLVRGSYSGNKVEFVSTQQTEINDVFRIGSSSGKGTLGLYGNSARNSTTLFNFNFNSVTNKWVSDHASVTYKNFYINADAILAFPGSSGANQAQDISIFKSNIVTEADHGPGRRLFLDFRHDDVDMFTADMSGSLYAFGNISGSATSTGSFGAIQSAGNITPKTDDSVDLGSADLRFQNVFTTDLQLNNEGTSGNEVDGTTGSWTIQEGEEELYLLNRKSGKKYKFMLQEIK